MKKLFLTKLPFALALLLIFVLGFSLIFSVGGVAFASESASQIGKLSIGHISDIHYFPLEHCYKQPTSLNYKDSDFYSAMTGDTKLVLESGVILNATVQSIIADAKAGKAPQIVIASGDLCKNGERVALIDVANSLRYMQNEVRKFNGYSDFQVFVTPGNHDLYNGDGALYTQDNGTGYQAETITAMQFALIFAGLGFPDANLTGAGGAVNLTEYFEASYWSSDYTDGYQASVTARNLNITYFSKELAEGDYIKLGHYNNVLSYAVSFTGSLAGYTMFGLDSSDREATTELVPVRISQKEFNVNYTDEDPAAAANKFKKGAFYKENTDEAGIVSYEPIKTPEDALAAFNAGTPVFTSAGYGHFTGGRLTTQCLNWVDKIAAEQKGETINGSAFEETMFGVFHHNALPHFDQEDDLLKDFTLYNWEYTAKRLLSAGIRYTLTGHMHTTDTTSYTDAEGRTLFDSQTGSSVSYDSPRRYLNVTRNNLGGNKLGETYETAIHLLGSLKGIADNHITTAAEWNEIAYQNAKASAGGNIDEIVAANPNYYAMSVFYDEFTTKTFNQYIDDHIYGQLIDRLLDHFLNEKMIMSLISPLHDMFEGENSILNNFLGGILKDYGGLINKLLDYIISVVLGTDPEVEDLYNDEYPYKDQTYPDIFGYLLAVIDGLVGSSAKDIEGLMYGDAALGKINVGELLVSAYVTHLTGREMCNELNGSPSDMIYVEGTATDPVYRARMAAAIDDLLTQCENGQFVEDLLAGLLEPLLTNDNSLIDALLNYSFDFTKANLTALQLGQLNTLIGLINTVLPDLIDSDIEIKIDITNVKINDLLQQLLPVLGGLLSDSLGITIKDNDLIATLNGFLDDYLVESFYVGIGGIAANIVRSFIEDASPDMKNIANPEETLLVVPHSGYGGYADKIFTYISGVPASASYNSATRQNGRLPSHVTANFDTVNSTNSFTVKFYTAEDVFGTFRFKDSVTGEWKTVETTEFTNHDKVTASDPKNRDLYYSASTTNGNITITTQSVPQNIPLIDLGLLTISNTPTYYTVEGKNGDVIIPYGALDRDAASKNSVIYWNVHTVTVTGLSPDTTYYYDLLGNYTTSSGNKIEFSLCDASDEDYFTMKTAKSADADSFDFLAVADFQGMIDSMYTQSAEAMDVINNTNGVNGYDFILNAGDMTDNGDNFYQWGYALNNLSGTFANTSTFFAAGNHEKESNAVGNFFNYTLGNNHKVAAGSDGYYYSFNYANAHFIVLDTNDLSADSNLSSKQMSWLRSDLMQNDYNDNTNWTFVLMHKSLYSTGSHAFDKDVVMMRDDLTDLFHDYNVDIVFGGHDHTYSTTHLINGSGNSDGECVSEYGTLYRGSGVLYVTLGTMGTKYYAYKESDAVTPNVDEDNSITEQLTSQTFGYISVSGETLTYKGYKFNAETNQIEEVSNIVMSNDREIAINSAIAANTSTQSVYKIGFTENSITEIDIDYSKIPNGFKVVYVANGTEYAKLGDIKIKGSSTKINVVMKDAAGSSVIKTITVEKENYVLAISLIAVCLTVALTVAITIPTVLAVKKRKKQSPKVKSAN